MYDGAKNRAKTIPIGHSVAASGLSLTWLYRQKDLDLRSWHLSGDNFRIIQPSELVDTAEFVQPNSVILTVGVVIPDSYEAYVRRLKDAGAVGIGFGTGLVSPTVPPALIDAARTNNISIFEVPRSTPFTAILSTVQEEYARRRLRAQQQLLDAQELLNDIAIDSGVSELVAATAERLDATIAVADNDGRSIARTADLTPLIDAALSNGGRSAAYRRGDAYVLIHRMSGEGERYHLLVAQSPTPFSAQERSLIKHCAGLADIILQRPAGLRQASSELNTLAMSLLLGVEQSQQAMVGVFSIASDSAGRVRPVVVDGDDPARFHRDLNRLDQRLMLDGRQMFLFHLDETTALVLFRGSRSVAEIISLFGIGASHLRLALGNPVHWQELSMRTVEELAAVAASLRIGHHAGPDNRTLRWVDNPAVHDALATRFAETYQQLIDHDTEHNGHLVDTLDAYLRSGNRVAVTAQTLGVHRHTVRTRLETVERVAEVVLSDPAVCAELLVLSLVGHKRR